MKMLVISISDLLYFFENILEVLIKRVKKLFSVFRVIGQIVSRHL